MKQLLTLTRFIALWALVASWKASAQTDVNTSIMKVNQINTSTSFIVEDQQLSYMLTNPSNGANGWDDLFCILDSDIDVILEYDESVDIPMPSNWSVTVNYNITLYNESHTAVKSYSGYALTLINDGSTTKDKVYHNFAHDPGFSGNENIEKAVISFPSNPTSTGLSGSIPGNFYLRLNSNVQRKYIVPLTAPSITAQNYTSKYTSANNYGLDPSVVHNRNEVNLTWDYIPGVENYELEWVFIDIGPGATASDAFSYDFRDAARISLSKTNYAVTLAYPRGWILYRVRGVSHDCSGNQVVTGWSGYGTGSGSNVTKGSLPSQGFIGYNGLEPAINWQYTANFGEEALTRQSINFFDGSMRSREGVTHFKTENDAVIQRSLYDYQGRPGAEILPFASNYQGLKYYNNIDKSAITPAEDFDREYFDKDSLSINDKKMLSSGNGAANYYSPSSSYLSENPFLPNAEGIPYTRTKYYNDGSERVKSIS
ncbi:MAG: hypothetical protein ACPF9D_05800, partial [Owenweeksia sp.]